MEYPNSKEFSGRMVARTLQPTDAARYAISAEVLAFRVASARAALADYVLVKHVEATDEYIVRVEIDTENEVAGRLMAIGGFQYVEPDWYVWPVSANCTTDTNLPSQWHHNANRMNSCAGWAIETGDPSIVVGVCDTGVLYLHEDLQLNRQEGYHAPSGLMESQGGQVIDINGHGTNTTGCAAANGDNGVGVSGVGWNLGHRMCRVTDIPAGVALVSDINDGARKSSDLGDRVVSVSFAGVDSASVQTTGQYIRNADNILVWAAGNDGALLSGVQNDYVVCVAATTNQDARASFSNYGQMVDVAAPGENVYTTSFTTPSSYASVSGTSFSCPLAAGLLGLIFSVDPSLSPAQAEAYLRAGCDDLGQPGNDNFFGHGRIDVYETLLLIPTCNVQPLCGTSPNTVGPGSLISNSGSASVAANDFAVETTGSPLNKASIFFTGTTAVSNPFGNGTRCAGGSIIRFPVQFTDGAGNANLAIDNTAPNLLGQIVPGSTWHWQFWYRDPAGVPDTFNLSDAISVTYCQ